MWLYIYFLECSSNIICFNPPLEPSLVEQNSNLKSFEAKQTSETTKKGF